MFIHDVLRAARDSVTSMLSKVALPAERPPVLGSVVDDFFDLRLPARNDLGIEFVHIPSLGERAGFSLNDSGVSPHRSSAHGLVKIKVQSPEVSGFVVMSEGDARHVEWALEQQAETFGCVSEIPERLAARFKSK